MGETKEVKLEIVEIPTQTTRAYKLGDKILSEVELLQEIYNEIQIIKKGIV